MRQPNQAPLAAGPLAGPLAGTCADYATIREAIAFLTQSWRDQPPLGDVAAHLGLSETQFQKLFRRWAGITPKQFVQALTLDHAKALLKDRVSVLDAAYEVGLSGPGRLHDLFVTYEAMSPGEFKSGGEGMVMYYGFHPSPFGEALVIANERGIAGLAFGDGARERSAVLDDMTRRWPRATYVEAAERTAPYARRIFEQACWRKDQPLRVVLIGTDFEIRVWESLLRIPLGRATTYGDIAAHLGKPTAARAVGAAVGKNPISFVVPCHRVLGKSGALTGYHWGLARKQAMIGWEAGVAAS